MTNCLPDYESWAELEMELAEAHPKLVIEGQDANYTRMFNEIVELKKEIDRLRNIPRPHKPHHFEDKELAQWEYDVDFYESHMCPQGESK